MGSNIRSRLRVKVSIMKYECFLLSECDVKTAVFFLSRDRVNRAIKSCFLKHRKSRIRFLSFIHRRVCNACVCVMSFIEAAYSTL